MMLCVDSVGAARAPRCCALLGPYAGAGTAPCRAAPLPAARCPAVVLDPPPALPRLAEHAVRSRPVPAEAALAMRSVRSGCRRARARMARNEGFMLFGRANRGNRFHQFLNARRVGR